MTLRNKLITGIGVVTLTVLSLTGCGAFKPHPTKNIHYIDFDGDGDLDLIVGTKSDDVGEEVKLYFFENIDGKGKLKFKTSYSE